MSRSSSERRDNPHVRQGEINSMINFPLNGGTNSGKNARGEWVDTGKGTATHPNYSRRQLKDIVRKGRIRR